MSSSILFIDSRVDDYHQLLSNLPNNTKVHALNTEKDGILQMAEILAEYSELSSIQVVSHGASGALSLGSTVLSADNLLHYEDILAQIGTSLSETGDILLYGCDVAQGDTGLHFVNRLAEITQADVATSDDLSGSIQNSDWELEVNAGKIDTTVLQMNTAYANTLAIVPTNLDFSATDQSMWKDGQLNVTENVFQYTKNITKGFSVGGSKWWGGGFKFWGNANINIDTEVSAHLAATKGDVDLDYGVNIYAKLPDNVEAGDSFTLDTSRWSVSDNASLNTDNAKFSEFDLDGLATLIPGVPSLNQRFGSSNFHAGIDFLDIDLNLDAYLTQDFSFIPTGINVDLLASTGERQNGKLGDKFTFSSPDTGNGDMTITADYSIDGVLKNKTGIALKTSLDIEALRLYGKVYGWSGEIGPLYKGSFPEDGLKIGDPQQMKMV